MLKNLLAFTILFLLSQVAVNAQERSNTEVGLTKHIYTPPDLTAWIKWIQQSNPTWECARNSNSFECVWPGNLHYSLKSSGADFTISIEMLNEGQVVLPSSPGLYPRQITVRNEAAEIISAPLSLIDGHLWVKLPKGKLEIRGSFVWSTLPPELPVPGSYGIVEVELPEDLKNLKARRGTQSLWLEKKEENSSTESLSLTVMRRIEDGSPLTIETLLKIRISGRSRPLQIPNLLPESSQPVTLQSPLPAQLSSEGTLALQLLPGEYEVRILSLMQQPVSLIKVPNVKLEGWPKEEVWSWQPDMGLRSVELSGGQPLHADLTQLPSEWKGGAVYVLNSSEKMEMNETRRGEQSQAPNNISLNREIWIDLDGSGSTIRDRFSGQLNQDFRINALPQLLVGRATVDGESALVTVDPKTNVSGVELRSQALNMEVVSKVANSRDLDATGWDITADNLSLTLNLPPSWKLLYVAGAARAFGSWVDSWTLLDIFISILLVLAAYKLFALPVSIVLGVSLFLNHAEFLSPRMLYVHLMLLAAWRLLTDAKESIWRSLSHTLLIITYIAWVLQSLAFAKLQFTEALFPQLQAGTRFRTAIQDLAVILEDSLLVWPILLLLLAVGFLAIRSILKSESVGKAIFRIIVYGVGCMILSSVLTGFYATFSYRRTAAPIVSRMEKSTESYYDSESAPQSSPMEELGSSFGGIDKKKEYSSKTNSTSFSYQGKNLLSGPALPTWRWRSFPIEVSAPVSSDHKIKFYLLNPEIGRVLSTLRAALSLLLIILVFRALGFSIIAIQTISGISKKSIITIATLSIFLCPLKSIAEIPNSEILGALQNKLEQRLCNREQCTVIESAKFLCSESKFKLELEVSSDGISSIQIPGPIEVLSPEKVRLNGKETVAMRRSDDGYLVILTIPGKNLIELEGPLPDPQAFTVQFSQRPLFVSIEAVDWYIEGLNGSGIVQENLRFIRRTKEDQTKDISASSSIEGLDTWVKVTRHITVGEQISIQTIIERIGSFAREAHVRVALLPGEQVTSGSVNIENSELLVGFAAGMQQQSFSSVIPYTQNLNLTAKSTDRIAEQWIFACQPILSCEFSGIKPISSIIDGMQAFKFLPFPSETVSLKIQALTGLKGDFITVDQLNHELRWGANLEEGKLTANVRATQQTTFRISVPNDVSIKEVTLNGLSGQSSEKGQESSLLLSPGSHSVSLTYSKNWKPTWKEFVPEISVGAPVNNLTVTVHPSEDRWLLWTGGLAWGPCVVFWVKLLLVVALCITLSRLSLIPGSLFSAILLGAGLTTLPLWAIAFPLSWLVSLMLIPNITEKLLFLPRWFRSVGFILLSIVALAFWYGIVQTGLVFSPPMLIAGNGSSSFSLNWYTDHVMGALPTPYIISLPIWCWRAVALIWSTWLVVALFGWLRRCVGIIRSEFVVAARPNT